MKQNSVAAAFASIHHRWLVLVVVALVGAVATTSMSPGSRASGSSGPVVRPSNDVGESLAAGGAAAPPAPEDDPPKVVAGERVLSSAEVDVMVREALNRLLPYGLANITGPSEYLEGAGSSQMSTSEWELRDNGISTTLLISRANGERPSSATVVHKLGKVKMSDAMLGKRGDVVLEFDGPVDVSQLTPLGYSIITLTDPDAAVRRTYELKDGRWNVNVVEILGK